MLKDDIDSINKSAYQFSSGVSDLVKEICAPLSKVDIDFFRYLKVFEDCSYITLMNGYNEFLSHYYETIKDLGKVWGKYIRYAEDPSHPFYLLWPQDGYSKDVNMGLFYSYNIWNGISLIYRNKDNVEIISFAFGRQKESGAEFFLNCQNFLEEFADYFRSKLPLIVGSEERDKRALFPDKFDVLKRSDYFAKKKEILRKSIEPVSNILNTKKCVVRLTEKEMQCLELLARGGTAKEVAKDVGISYRTVEYHLSRLKSKTGSQKKSDLLDLFFKNRNLVNAMSSRALKTRL